MIGDRHTVTMRATRLPSDTEAEKIDRLDKLEGLAGRGYEQLGALSDADRGRLFATEDGRLWVRAPGEGPKGREAGVDAFYPAADLQPLWFRRPPSGPQTVDELRERQERNRKTLAARVRAEAKRLREIQKAATHVVTWRDLEGAGAPVSLAAAAGVVERNGGRLDIVNDRLRVVVPVFGQNLRLASKMLYMNERTVLECLRGGKPLPDRELTGAGAAL